MVKTDCVKKKQQQQQKKRPKNRLSEKNGNPKEKWEFAKYLVMPIKVVICNFSVMEEKHILTYNTRLTSNIFKSFFSNLAGSLLIKPSNPLDKGNLQAVIICYSVFTISGNFSLRNTSEENILQIMENIESSKATGADKLSSWFLEDGANILEKCISALCNLSISQGFFQNACRLAKPKSIFNKKKKNWSFQLQANLIPSISFEDHWKGNLLHLCLSFLTDKVLKGFEEGILIKIRHWA